MINFFKRSAHEFHIPVMGTGFTIGSPFDVARYGISSVVSLVDDVLIEQMRRYYTAKYGKPYEAIGGTEHDARARRICAYLNLMNTVVGEQSASLRASPFEPGSEITRYYELLPAGELKSQYQKMLVATDAVERLRLQADLREQAVPGGIDVNIMTKLDRLPLENGTPMAAEFSDGLSALRGYATSDVSSGIVFSAGLNASLYSSLSDYPDFRPDASGRSKKTVILKVSDYRSALIQGRFLAKRGIWVSEFRIESGLNCGGHAFATQGFLMGPILEEFKNNREELCQRLHEDYNKGLVSRGLAPMAAPRDMLVTVQGGIGTHAEHRALLQYYKMDGTGWATPFLLVPEATSVDDEHLTRLLAATEADVKLGLSSPMGIPFWTLQTAASEEQRRKHIADGNPGSDCPKGYLELNTEFEGTPLCIASHDYQRQKLAQIDASDLPPATKARVMADVLAKSCICHDLGAGATLKAGIVKTAYTSICPSLTIVHFKALASLEEMVGHIYGRISLMKDSDRPHMFIRELSLYVDHLRNELARIADGVYERKLSYYAEFKQNLMEGISYYQDRFMDFVSEHQDRFCADLSRIKSQIEQIQVDSCT
ncbi:MAG TPA: hypothetical protein DCS43_01055 [Verrucomicrobia bacterium]|nr:hypothetical protein [Verrucomicrobiota bacterium]